MLSLEVIPDWTWQQKDFDCTINTSNFRCTIKASKLPQILRTGDVSEFHPHPQVIACRQGVRYLFVPPLEHVPRGILRSICSTCTVGSSPPPLWKGDCTDPSWPRTDRSPGRGLLLWKNVRVLHLHMWGIMANMVLCVIPGQGNSKILNLVKSGSFDSPIFLYIPNDEKTSTGHLIWPQPFIWQPFLEISCPGMTLWI